MSEAALKDAIKRKQAADVAVQNIGMQNIAGLSMDERFDLALEYQKAIAEQDAAMRTVVRAREEYLNALV